jgi:hypothetical protein
LIRDGVEQAGMPLGEGQGRAWKKILSVARVGDGPNWHLSYSSAEGPNGHTMALDKVVPRLQSLYDLVERA